MSVVGWVYNKLTVLEDLGSVKWRRRVSARCECGVVKKYALTDLKTGNTKSCGCSAYLSKTKHGQSGHPLYKVWQGMIDRCTNEKNERYRDYGGRGVSISSRWRNDFGEFYDWAKDKWKRGLHLDKDIRSGMTTGNFYCPELCCFVTPKENSRKKRNSIILKFDGKEVCLKDWASIVNIPYGTLMVRYNHGWDTEKLLTTPVDTKFRHKNVNK